MQPAFVNNPLSGWIILCGLFLPDWRIGVGCIVGGTIGMLIEVFFFDFEVFGFLVLGPFFIFDESFIFFLKIHSSRSFFKKIPSDASLFKFGVFTTLASLKPISFHPRSSAR